MNRRERIEAAIHHHYLDRVPTDLWATVEVQEMLCEYFKIEEGKDQLNPCIGLNGGGLSRGVNGIIKLMDILDIDGIFNVSPPYIGPSFKNEKDVIYNEWGCGFKSKKYAFGYYWEQVIFPLSEIKTIEDLQSYIWPDPDWYDYSQLPEIINKCGERAVNVGYSAVFTYHNYLRGLEQSLVDPILEPEITKEIITRISSFFYEYHKRCFESVGKSISVTQVTDDWGSQNGLITSPDVFTNFYKEPMRRAIKLAQSYNIAPFHHDDGDCRALLPTFVDLGIKVLNPIQWRSGNWDLKGLKLDHGAEVCFHSGVDNQKTLPYGSPVEVSLEVKMLLDILAADSTGFIIGPCHNLQPNTPIENILALYKAARI